MVPSWNVLPNPAKTDRWCGGVWQMPLDLSTKSLRRRIGRASVRAVELSSPVLRPERIKGMTAMTGDLLSTIKL